MHKNLPISRLAKKDLILLYNISYPTLRRWLRRAGLAQFIGRKKLNYQEICLIFRHLGRPHLARTAAQRLLDRYNAFLGQASDQERYKEQFQEELPKVKQDTLPATSAEVDHPPVLTHKPQRSTAPIPLWDALSRLRLVALQLLANKAINKQVKNIRPIKHRKRLSKSRLRAA